MLRRLVLASGLLLCTLAWPGQAAEAIDPPFPFTVTEALAFDAATRLPLTAFYNTPDPLPPGEPGALIRFEEATTDYAFVPAEPTSDTGMKVYRFLYHSRAFDGKDVPASGVIILPYGDPPDGGWPVIAWAHGTSGVGRIAAPSLDSHLVYGWEGLLMWPTLGYAVVATDYAGLGSNVPHQYLVAASQANDVINGFTAAREAIPELGRKWVAVGHSQGARSVIEVALMQNEIRDPGYLGAIALAPGLALDLGQFLDALQQTPYRGYLAFVAFGAKASFPEFRYEEVLTPEAAAHMAAAESSGWMGTMATFAWEVPPGEMLNEDWRKSETFNRYTAMSLVVDSPAWQPILLLAGGADTTVPPQTVEAAHDELEAAGADIVYREYPGLDHDPLVFGSFRDQLRWVEDRFAGTTSPAE